MVSKVICWIATRQMSFQLTAHTHRLTRITISPVTYMCKIFFSFAFFFGSFSSFIHHFIFSRSLMIWCFQGIFGFLLNLSLYPFLIACVMSWIYMNNNKYTIETQSMSWIHTPNCGENGERSLKTINELNIHLFHCSSVFELRAWWRPCWEWEWN